MRILPSLRVYRPDGLEEHIMRCAAAGFLVAVDRSKNLGNRIFFECRGLDTEACEISADGQAIFRAENPQEFRNPCLNEDAVSYCKPVGQRVVRDEFDRVPHGVSKIQNAALVPLFLILHDNARLYAHRAVCYFLKQARCFQRMREIELRYE